MVEFRTLGAALIWLDGLPVGTQLTASAMADLLRPVAEEATVIPPPEAVRAPETWRERLWTVPAETRLGVAEVCEAFDRPRSWLYKHTSAGTIPHRKFDGVLTFAVGELRAWAREREEIVAAGPMESPSYLKAS